MDQSLDSIIKNKQKERRENRKPVHAPRKTFKAGGGGRGGNKFGNAVTSSRNKVVVQVRRERDESPPVRERSSVFDRLGTVDSVRKDVSGTKVAISGLTSAVTTTDITQLCESIGEVKNVLKKSNSADVVFARRSDAMSAIKKFHGLTLDGVAMKVTLAGERGKPNPFDPNAEPSEDAGDRRGGNVREGFFGTRGGGNEDVAIDYGYKKKANPSRGIKVTIRK